MPSQPIRVLQLIDSFGVGGAERLVATLATKLDPERFSVIPCAIGAGGPLVEEFRAAGVPYHVLGIQRRSVLTGPLFLADLRRVVTALARTLREDAVDIIHCHMTEGTLLGLLGARRAGLRGICATVHNVIVASPRRTWDLRRWLLQRAMDSVFARVDRIITVSAQVATTIQRSTKIPGRRVVTIPNGVEAERYHRAEDRRELRQRLGLADSRPLAITVGRLVPQKGHTYLFAALARLPEARRPLTLIVGDGPDRAMLQSRVVELGLAQDVQFLGNRTDVPLLLGAADIFVLPSLWEGLPLVLLEAMAAGVPTVITAVGGNPEVIEDGKSGLLVPPADASALATAMRALLDDPQQRASIRQHARQRFDRHFSMQQFVRAHERLYEELITERGGHSPAKNRAKRGNGEEGEWQKE